MLRTFPAIGMMIIIIILACALNVRKYKEHWGHIDWHSSCMAICLTQPPILSLIWKLQPFYAPAVQLSVSQLSNYLIISNLTAQVMPSFFIFSELLPLFGLYGLIPDITTQQHSCNYLVTSLTGRKKRALEAKV